MAPGQPESGERRGGLLAARIIASGSSDFDLALRLRLDEMREEAAHKVMAAGDSLRARRAGVTGFGV